MLPGYLIFVPQAFTRFRHLVHASDADQAEALLRRWAPDGMGKLGGEVLYLFVPLNAFQHTQLQTRDGLTPLRMLSVTRHRQKLSLRLLLP